MILLSFKLTTNLNMYYEHTKIRKIKQMAKLPAKNFHFL